MEEKFRIKSYGYGELAQLYFPKASKRSASVQFRRWIVFNKKLENELLKNGFQPGLRLLTPKQVKLIVDYLGEPN